MRSKVFSIIFSQKQTQVKEDHFSNLFSTKRAIDAYLVFTLKSRSKIKINKFLRTYANKYADRITK